LESFSDKMPEFEAAMLKARASGPGATPTHEAAYAAYIKSADRIKQRLAEMIEKSPELRSAVDAAGAAVGFSGFSGHSELEAYFGDVQSPSAKVLELLKDPIDAGLKGFSQVAQEALQIAARFAGPAWKAMLTLLKNPTVKLAVGGLIAKDAVVQGLNVALNGDVIENNRSREALINSGHGSEAPPPSSGSGLGIVVMGLVAVGGLALYLKSKSSSATGSRSSSKSMVRR
jgi:hypothetical protein